MSAASAATNATPVNPNITNEASAIDGHMMVYNIIKLTVRHQQGRNHNNNS